VTTTFPQVVDLTTFKVEVESNYIGTGDPTVPRLVKVIWPMPIIPLPGNGNRTGKLRVRATAVFAGRVAGMVDPYTSSAEASTADIIAVDLIGARIIKIR